MGLLGKLFGDDINKGVEKCKSTDGAVLVDVREEDEYRSGHIPGSINIPLSRIEKAKEHIPDVNAPLFIYCLSGRRAQKATKTLESFGFNNVKNIGGINQYTGMKVMGE